MSWSGKLVTHNAMRVMELFGMIPKGTWEVGETLKIAGDALVKGGQTKVYKFFFLRLLTAHFLLTICSIYLALHSDVPCHQQETQVELEGFLSCLISFFYHLFYLIVVRTPSLDTSFIICLFLLIGSWDTEI